MSSSRPTPAKHIPTLTEVVELTDGRQTAPRTAIAPETQEFPATLFDAGGARGAEEISEEELIQRILAELQRQVDLMLEYRLREALAPALARATDALVRDTRNELAQAMRDLVARAVSQELSRHR